MEVIPLSITPSDSRAALWQLAWPPGVHRFRTIQVRPKDLLAFWGRPTGGAKAGGHNSEA